MGELGDGAGGVHGVGAGRLVEGCLHLSFNKSAKAPLNVAVSKVPQSAPDALSCFMDPPPPSSQDRVPV